MVPAFTTLAARTAPSVPALRRCGWENQAAEQASATPTSGRRSRHGAGVAAHRLAECIACRVDAVVVVLDADLVGDAESVELRAQRGAGVGDAEHDTPSGELADDLHQCPAAGVVEIVHCDGVEDEPAGR